MIIEQSWKRVVKRFILFAVLCLACVYGTSAANLPAGFANANIANLPGKPTAMDFAPDGRLFVCQQTGELLIITNDVLLGTPFITLPVNSVGEHGLLGIAFDPGFATNHFLYVYYTAATPAVHNRVSRLTANGNAAVADSEVVLLELESVGNSNHNGGAIHFGTDGKLYIAVGDHQGPNNAQTLANRFGKMLRINPDGTIPADNPFYNLASGANRSIWAMGLRNPFTFAVQPGTGRIFINDVGEGAWEEIDEGAAGANYGWPTCEGACNDSSFVDPIYQYPHSGGGTSSGCSIVGGAFYDPATHSFPASYAGLYFFGELCNGWINTYAPASGTVSNFATGVAQPVDLKVSSDGKLYYAARNGASTAFIGAISFTNAPALQIVRSGVEVILSWPAPSPGFTLQSASSLPATRWTTVPNPVVVVNNTNTVHVSLGEDRQFFRLFKP